MSLYRFKSRETGDLVMLEPTGQRVLDILGKDPSGPGIILPEQMAAAVQALRDAVVQEEAEQKRLKEEAEANGDLPPEFDVVSLRLRCAPFIEMLQRCEQAGVEIVWGV
ncbi:MAG: DUF1840 domain-containing protein [Hydrogenophaga sp.]|jgi:hypothetical protein|uniref:DUF1840 domain-containing protein n=1 Tax=Hydrogenophaga sp. TaxID=1904254 RepID=UPI002720233A|nr:DUF1840 domain-containing protein [Hydrogenophaga sp.]MDO9480016.1 DUF1840 domain-containing protein [Hydrogenophaga sp.]MDO9571795.1 DUF1840 domain-containing protein [Hydrogenophaga sp.]MDP1896104.1 DUF1840 domain-containing protein [Hydrogenophaga sp.]MDP2093379.1 DUF1840 domain-containing protein [Hydrogenophaga sp.]MDP2219631.1 DUF1840 domain-containing protein [Hydrogenophaga sp.]